MMCMGIASCMLNIRSSFVMKMYAFGFGVCEERKKMFYIAIILLRLFILFCHHIMYDIECGILLLLHRYAIPTIMH